MTKLTKKQLADRDKLANELEDAFTQVQNAIQAYNDAITGNLWFAIENAVNDYNEKLVDARELQTEILTEIEEVIDGKSDKWQESDRGQAYLSWKDAWELIDLNCVECPEQPASLEFDSDEASSASMGCSNRTGRLAFIRACHNSP